MANPVTSPAPAPDLSSVGSLTSTANTIGQDSYNLILSEYPNLAWLLNIPQLATIIQNAAQSQWSTAELTNAIENTDWWKTNSAAVRNWYQQAITDPATAQQQIAAMTLDVQSALTSLGVKATQNQLSDFATMALANGWTQQQVVSMLNKGIQVDQNGNFTLQPWYMQDGKQVDLFTGRPAYYGPQNQAGTADPAEAQKLWGSDVGKWTQPDGTIVYYQANGNPNYTIQNGQEVDAYTGRPAYYGPGNQPGANYTPGLTIPTGDQVWTDPTGKPVLYNPNMGGGTSIPGGGQLGYVETQLKQIAAQYMVPMTQQTLGQWSRQINANQSTLQGFQAYMQQMAKSAYPWMSDVIDQGVTPQAYADTYKQMVASTLNVDPSGVNMMSPQYSKLMYNVDPNSGQVSPNTLFNAQLQLMQDPSYGFQNTKNAVDTASQMAQAIGTMFGKTTGGGGLPGFTPRYS